MMSFALRFRQPHTKLRANYVLEILLDARDHPGIVRHPLLLGREEEHESSIRELGKEAASAWLLHGGTSLAPSCS